MTANEFIACLEIRQSDEELRKIQRYFKSDDGDYGAGDRFMGVKMGAVFDVAKQFTAMPLSEVEKLLENDIHEIRVGAVSIMDFQARNRKTPESRKKELFDLYLRRHDRINNWDLVDRSATFVIGSYLFDKSRDILYKLAKSENIWERRTAIVSTGYFIRKDQTDDTFAIAEILLNDSNDIINKPVGGWLREAGKKSQEHLIAFLDQYAATMPRVTLRYAIEHFDSDLRKYYLNLKSNQPK